MADGARRRGMVVDPTGLFGGCRPAPRDSSEGLRGSCDRSSKTSKAPDFAKETNLAGYIDRHYLPGKIFRA